MSRSLRHSWVHSSHTRSHVTGCEGARSCSRTVLGMQPSIIPECMAEGFLLKELGYQNRRPSVCEASTKRPRVSLGSCSCGSLRVGIRPSRMIAHGRLSASASHLGAPEDSSRLVIGDLLRRLVARTLAQQFSQADCPGMQPPPMAEPGSHIARGTFAVVCASLRCGRPNPGGCPRRHAGVHLGPRADEGGVNGKLCPMPKRQAVTNDFDAPRIVDRHIDVHGGQRDVVARVRVRVPPRRPLAREWDANYW